MNYYNEDNLDYLIEKEIEKINKFKKQEEEPFYIEDDTASFYNEITELWECNNVIENFFFEHRWGRMSKIYRNKRNAIDDNDFENLKKLAEELMAIEKAGF